MRNGLVFLLFATTAGGLGGKTVNVFSNGESTDSLELTVPENVENLTEFIGQRKPAKLFGTNGVPPDRVYNSKAVIVERYDQLVEGERLYVAAPGLRFVWPFVERGHSVTLEPEYFAENWRPSGPVTLTSLYDKPRVFNLSGFFDDEDADTLIRNVESITDPLTELQRSGVGPEITKSKDKKVTSQVRTSSNAFDSSSDTAKKLNRRAFELTRIPYDDLLVDGLQLLRYNQREAYIPHTDWFPSGSGQTPHNFEPHRGGTNRFATVFLYLSDVEEGGQTVFPYGAPLETQNTTVPAEAEELFTPGQWEYEMVQKCYHNLSVAPRKGSAVIFYHQTGDGQMQQEALHGGCPVLRGQKWAANLWVWNGVRYGLNGTSGTPDTSGQMKVDIQNTLSERVHVFYGDSELNTIGPGETSPYTTYAGHKFNARLPSDLTKQIWSCQIEHGNNFYIIDNASVDHASVDEATVAPEKVDIN